MEKEKIKDQIIEYIKTYDCGYGCIKFELYSENPDMLDFLVERCLEIYEMLGLEYPYCEVITTANGGVRHTAKAVYLNNLIPEVKQQIVDYILTNDYKDGNGRSLKKADKKHFEYVVQEILSNYYRMMNNQSPIDLWDCKDIAKKIWEINHNETLE
jgi:hypothetical protein